MCGLQHCALVSGPFMQCLVSHKAIRGMERSGGRDWERETSRTEKYDNINDRKIEMQGIKYK